MKIGKVNIENNVLLRALFLLVFWGTWFLLPFLNAGSDEKFIRFHQSMMPVNLTLIPLFFLNSEVLIPKILIRRNAGLYLLSIVILTAIYIFLHSILKEAFLDPTIYRGFNFNRTFYPILTIIGVSSGYGLIEYLTQQEKKQEEEKQERLKSELSFLRSQISPHFIFNVLNSIVYLIRSKSNQAEDMTIKLSEIMQYMLYTSPEDKVPLEKEISYLKNYIHLQEARFGEDVEIDFKIDGDLAMYQIEPMLIIPFVENAFKHGVGRIHQPQIGIHIRLHDHQMDLEVKNKFDVNFPVEKSQEGIGLKNVKRRLELLYPSSHILKINTSDQWFIVHLNLSFAK
jgi:sensor histidine kinase YesM